MLIIILILSLFGRLLSKNGVKTITTFNLFSIILSVLILFKVFCMIYQAPQLYIWIFVDLLYLLFSGYILPLFSLLFYGSRAFILLFFAFVLNKFLQEYFFWTYTTGNRILKNDLILSIVFAINITVCLSSIHFFLIAGGISGGLIGLLSSDEILHSDKSSVQPKESRITNSFFHNYLGKFSWPKSLTNKSLLQHNFGSLIKPFPAVNRGEKYFLTSLFDATDIFSGTRRIKYQNPNIISHLHPLVKVSNKIYVYATVRPGYLPVETRRLVIFNVGDITGQDRILRVESLHTPLPSSYKVAWSGLRSCHRLSEYSIVLRYASENVSADYVRLYAKSHSLSFVANDTLNTLFWRSVCIPDTKEQFEFFYWDDNPTPARTFVRNNLPQSQRIGRSIIIPLRNDPSVLIRPGTTYAKYVQMRQFIPYDVVLSDLIRGQRVRLDWNNPYHAYYIHNYTWLFKHKI